MELNQYKRKIFVFLFLLGIVFFACADSYSRMELFAQAFNVIKNNYFKSVKIETLIYGSIRGMLKEVDPHSQFLIPKDFKNLKQLAEGQFYGFGIQVYSKENRLLVVSVVKNSPAEKAGLKSGDQIVKIDGQNVKHFNRHEFNHFLKAKKNKKYKISVLRSGMDRPLVFKVFSKKIKVPTVELKEIKKNFFYLKIYYFSETTLFQINSLLKGKTIQAMVLDLRGNPGGIFKQAVKIADLFLDQGLIVKYKMRSEKQEKKFWAHHSDTLGDFPLALLINEYSASSSEVLAAALKDHDRAILIGRKTFGKGSIQNVFYLKNNHALKLTVGEYQTPSGKQIHNQGVEPDIEIKKESESQDLNSHSPNSFLKDLTVRHAVKILTQKLNKEVVN